MINRRVFQSLFAALFVALFALLFIPSARAADDAASLYETKCAACHAADGSGATPTGKAMGVLDRRSDPVQKQTDAQLIDATTNGKGKKMPACKGKLTDDQIKELVGTFANSPKRSGRNLIRGGIAPAGHSGRSRQEAL